MSGSKIVEKYAPTLRQIFEGFEVVDFEGGDVMGMLSFIVSLPLHSRFPLFEKLLAVSTALGTQHITAQFEKEGWKRQGDRRAYLVLHVSGIATVHE